MARRESRRIMVRMAGCLLSRAGQVKVRWAGREGLWSLGSGL